MPIAPLAVLAPAKINLTLHITGRRDDGYHLLDSLVVFADLGDHLTVTPGAPGLTIDGPEAAGLAPDASNLILRAAGYFAPHFAFHLTKNLPVAAGIGGGSADAAATCRALGALGAGQIAAPDLLALGADVPVCIASAPARMSGIGERLRPARGLPPLAALLVNPRQAVSTAQVFSGLNGQYGPPMPTLLPHVATPADLARWLTGQRNDMEAAAIRIAPIIGTVKAAIAAQAGCLLARMSGSGATCFGLFGDPAQAQRAQDTLLRAHPNWWVRACTLGDQSAAVGPAR